MPLLFAVALSAVNWTSILKSAPDIVSEARRLYEAVTKNRSASKAGHTADSGSMSAVLLALSEMRSTVEELEDRDVKQAEVISQIAAQGEALSRGLQIVSGRMTALLWVIASAMIIAVIGLVIAVLK